MDNHTLGLVPFASRDETLGLESTLSALGRHPVVIQPTAWFSAAESDRPMNPVLIFLGGRDYPAVDIRAALEVRRTAAIAIFDRDTGAFDPGIAASCRDFVHWPCTEQELRLRIERLCGTREPGRTRCDDAELLEEFAGLNLLGRSPVFIAVLKLIKRIAPCDAPVLVGGETGTGKELAARAIHYLSARRDHPFIPVNCGAIPESLVESELFGHELGAFTDARESRPGIVAQAEGGTIFLDEVETLTPKAQAALLRFLQDRQYRPLGGRRAQRADVRIITASNAQLEKLVEAGQFRQDLLFRIKIVSVTLPPLRERDGDAEYLAERFLRGYQEQYGIGPLVLDPRSREWLRAYPWPGNVRELENLMLRESLLADGSTLRLDVAPATPAAERRSGTADRRGNRWGTRSLRSAKSLLITDFECTYLRQLLVETGGNVSEAARRAGKERRAFGKLLKKYGIDRPALPGKFDERTR